MLQQTIRKSQRTNFVAIPYGMLDDITAVLDTCGIGITNVLRRPYAQLPPEAREDVMSDLDDAGVNGRRLVIEAAGDVDDMRAFVRDHLPTANCPKQTITASSPYDEAYARNTLYSELIDCYRDSIARGDAEAAAEESEELRNMWAEYEQTISVAIAYARKTDDVTNELAFASLLEDTKRCLLEDGVITPSL